MHSTQPAVEARPANAWAISAFILSLFAWQGIVVAWISLALAQGALIQIRQRGEGGRNLAEFARAFSIVLIIVMVFYSGDYHDWLSLASRYPLWPR